MKGVYAVVVDARGSERRLRVGDAEVNGDGTLTLSLRALPVGGRLVVGGDVPPIDPPVRDQAVLP